MSRRQRMLDWLANLVTNRRRLVIGLLLVITAGLASQIPKLRADPAPESLLSSFEGNSDRPELKFDEWFGETKKVVLLLVEAPDIFDPAVMQQVHDLSRHFESKEWVDDVHSLTVLNIPRRIEGGAAPDDDEEGETLDDLEDLDDLDSIEDEYSAETQDDFEDDVFDALLDIIESDSVRFSGGIGEIGPKLADELKTDPIVEGDTVAEENIVELKAALEDTPLLNGRLVSEDRTLTAVALQLRELGPKEMRLAMNEMRADLDQPKWNRATVYLGGLPYLRSIIVEKMRTDNFRLIPLTLLVCIILLWISFRWLPGVFLPIAAVAMTALMVVGGMGLFDQPMNILNNIIVPLLIIIGISDSIHLIGRYREEVSDVEDRAHAGQRTVRAMAVACLLTSVTTAVGLASLVVSRTVMLRTFGVTAAIGVLVAYIVTITFLPTILTAAKPPEDMQARRWDGWLEAAVVKLTVQILNWPKSVLLVTSCLVAVSIYGASLIVVDHALLDQFQESDPVYTTTRLIEEKLDGVQPLEVVLNTENQERFAQPETWKAVERIKAWAEERPAVIRSMSYGDVLRESLALIADDPTVREEDFRGPKQMEGLATVIGQREQNPLSPWLTDDRKHARLQIKVRDVGAQQTMRLIDDLELQLERVFGAPYPDVTYAITGEAYTGSRGQEAVVTDLLGSLFTAVVIIFILLAFLFRSVRLGLLSIPPNIIPLIGTMAYMVWRDIPLNVSTVIIFSISLGLAVDGTIHVLARFREETTRGLRSNAALIRAARGTGRAIVVSCVTLMAGFGVMLWSSFVPVQHFGELIAVTVGGCLLATLVVQPALLKVAGLRRSQVAALKAQDEAAAGK